MPTAAFSPGLRAADAATRAPYAIDPAAGPGPVACPWCGQRCDPLPAPAYGFLVAAAAARDLTDGQRAAFAASAGAVAGRDGPHRNLCRIGGRVYARFQCSRCAGGSRPGVRSVV